MERERNWNDSIQIRKIDYLLYNFISNLYLKYQRIGYNEVDCYKSNAVCCQKCCNTFIYRSRLLPHLQHNHVRLDLTKTRDNHKSNVRFVQIYTWFLTSGCKKIEEEAILNIALMLLSWTLKKGFRDYHHLCSGAFSDEIII